MLYERHHVFDGRNSVSTCKMKSLSTCLRFLTSQYRNSLFESFFQYNISLLHNMSETIQCFMNEIMCFDVENLSLHVKRNAYLRTRERSILRDAILRCF